MKTKQKNQTKQIQELKLTKYKQEQHINERDKRGENLVLNL